LREDEEVDPFLPLSFIVRGENEVRAWEQIRKLPRVFESKDIKGFPNNVKNVILRNLAAKGLIRRLEPGKWERLTDDVVVGFVDTRVKRVLDLVSIAASIVLAVLQQYVAAGVLLAFFILYSIGTTSWVRVVRLTVALRTKGGEEEEKEGGKEETEEEEEKD